MPSQLPLPERLAKDGWKVKIRDRERLEPPHATVIRGNRAWRWNLRSRQFMDREPDPGDLPLSSSRSWLTDTPGWFGTGTPCIQAIE